MSEAITLSSHVLDLGNGRPAQGLTVELYSEIDGDLMARAVTDADGRISDWGRSLSLLTGVYRLIFSTGDWYAARGEVTLYPQVAIDFHVDGTGQHYHIPLLLSAYGYSTYRGS